MKLPKVLHTSDIMHGCRISRATVTRLKQRGLPYEKLGYRTVCYPTTKAIRWLSKWGYEVAPLLKLSAKDNK